MTCGKQKRVILPKSAPFSDPLTLRRCSYLKFQNIDHRPGVIYVTFSGKHVMHIKTMWYNFK